MISKRKEKEQFQKDLIKKFGKKYVESFLGKWQYSCRFFIYAEGVIVNSIKWYGT